MGRMKAVTRILGAAGILVLVGLVLHEGAGAVMRLLAQAGWVLCWLLPLHALVLLLDVLGWRSLLKAQRPVRNTRVGTLFLLGAVREAVNRLLPVANVGGEILGIRLLLARGLPGPMAAANIIVELLMELVSQCLFLAAGLLCLLQATAAFAWTRLAALALAGGILVVAALASLLRYGSVFERLGRRIQSFLDEGSTWHHLLRRSGELDREIRRLCHARAHLLATIGFQFTALLTGTVENWLVLRWIGTPASPADALILESLAQLIRHFIFVVPAGVGVQEAGLVALGGVLGIAAPSTLALSLAKRAREVVFGTPFLLGWQWFETRRIGRRAVVPHTAGAAGADPQAHQ